MLNLHILQRFCRFLDYLTVGLEVKMRSNRLSAFAELVLNRDGLGEEKAGW